MHGHQAIPAVAWFSLFVMKARKTMTTGAYDEMYADASAVPVHHAAFTDWPTGQPAETVNDTWPRQREFLTDFLGRGVNDFLVPRN
jgi:hypothetical protein